MELVAKLSNVPYAALHVVAAELRKFGAEVVFDRERGRRGYVQHPLGKVEFLHDGDNALSLFVPVELGAIPRGGCFRAASAGWSTKRCGERR